MQVYGCGWGMGSGIGLGTCFGVHVDTRLGQGFGWTSFSNGFGTKWTQGCHRGTQQGCLFGTQRSARVAYVEKPCGFLAARVFLLVPIGFVGVHSGEVRKGGFPYKRGGFPYQFGGFLVLAGVFLFENGVVLVQSVGFFWYSPVVDEQILVHLSTCYSLTFWPANFGRGGLRSCSGPVSAKVQQTTPQQVVCSINGRQLVRRLQSINGKG